MISEQGNTPDDEALSDDEQDDESFTETIVIEGGDNVGGVSVEINVEELVSDIETAKKETEDGLAARRRLEALLEEKRLSRLLDEDDDFGIRDLEASD
ncbi:MAG: hypothetical protein AAFN07_04160 [Pseudomonadota bacterium]